jgi:hypothetical protein
MYQTLVRSRKADLSAEQIDRIEYNLANIDANLKKTDRHLRGIESVTSAIKNAWTKDETKGNNPVFTPIDRTVRVRFICGRGCSCICVPSAEPAAFHYLILADQSRSKDAAGRRLRYSVQAQE